MLYSRTVHTATLLPNGKVLVAGGGWYGFFGFTPSPTAELYDPTNGTFVETGMMVATNFTFGLAGHAQHTAALVTNGLVLITGGLGSLGAGTFTQSNTELYHPDTGIWTAAGTMTTRREIHTATLLANGHVLLAGGFDDLELDHARSSAELYSPVRATPPTLTNVQKLADGSFRFSFTNNPGAGFSALVSTNPALPLTNWTTMGGVAEISSGYFQFTDTYATNYPRRFYRLRSL
jgi:hypothetical protein